MTSPSSIPDIANKMISGLGIKDATRIANERVNGMVKVLEEVTRPIDWPPWLKKRDLEAQLKWWKELQANLINRGK